MRMRILYLYFGIGTAEVVDISPLVVAQFLGQASAPIAPNRCGLRSISIIDVWTT
jgi:hypothetical protein